MNTLTDSFSSAGRFDRPACMIALGLSPPYAAQDVKQAYLAKARLAHPDTGGDVAGFVKVQRAFEQATDYVLAHASPWAWIGDKAERYGKHEALIAELEKHGAVVEVERDKWLARSWGEDFVQLTEHIVGIRLRGPALSDAVLDRLVRDRTLLGGLRLLDLAYSTIDDEGLRQLSVLTSLKHLDLRGTLVTGRGLTKAVERLPNLRSLDLRGTSVSWWARFMLRWRFRCITIVASQPNLAIASGRATSARHSLAREERNRSCCRAF